MVDNQFLDLQQTSTDQFKLRRTTISDGRGQSGTGALLLQEMPMSDLETP
jgi:hypothetical protein